MKMAIFANWVGPMSRLSTERGFLMRVKMLSFEIIFKDSLAVMSSPAYSARMVFLAMKAVDTK